MNEDLPFIKPLFNIKRLYILREINKREWTTFRDLKNATGFTDGNLARHLGVLEKYLLIEIKKEFKNRKPCTSYRLIPAGRFHLDKLISWFLTTFGSLYEEFEEERKKEYMEGEKPK